ncbi:MAG: methyltransferase [Chitinophagaceae bacterium]|nr:methyltransferase [Chitinophagaceae bacterium]
MANNYFQFKQFIIRQDKCAMKVCTEACLFAAIVANEKIIMNQCLDIGTGTGLLSLMLAQKNDTVQVDAVEIDADAALQAAENINASPWANRIKVLNKDILTCTLQPGYDCIISNPPFYENQLQSNNESINKARHNSSLSIKHLINIVFKNLSARGTFAILLPYQRIDIFKLACAKAGLYLYKEILVSQTEKHSFFRGILFFKKEICNTHFDSLTIMNNNQYSNEFKLLLQDYYLNL